MRAVVKKLYFGGAQVSGKARAAEGRPEFWTINSPGFCSAYDCFAPQAVEQKPLRDALSRPASHLWRSSEQYFEIFRAERGAFHPLAVGRLVDVQTRRSALTARVASGGHVIGNRVVKVRCESAVADPRKP